MAAAYVPMPSHTIIITNPLDPVTRQNSKPYGRPKISIIFAIDSVMTPPRILLNMLTVGVKACIEKADVTYGTKANVMPASNVSTK